MATAVIGALRADLSANSAAFAADLAKARTHLTSFGARANQSLAALDKGFGRVGGAITGVIGKLNPLHGLLAAVSIGGLTVMVKRTLDAADAMAKAADSIGISTDALQEYRFAASLAGVSTQQLDGGLGAFVKRVGELRAGTGTLTTFLDKFDVGLKNALLGANSSAQALDLLFERAQNTGNAFDRSALFAAAFGRQAGQAMTNMIEGTQEAIAQARELGLVIEERLLRNAEATNDKMEVLATVIKTKVSVAILENAQLIGNLTDALIAAIPKVAAFVDEWARYIGLVNDPAAKVDGYLKGLNDRGAAIVTQLDAMREGAQAFARELEWMQKLLPADDPRRQEAEAYVARYQALQTELRLISDLTDQALAKLKNLETAPAAAGSGSTTGRADSPIARAGVLDAGDATEASKRAAKAYEEQMERITERVKVAQKAHEEFAARGEAVWRDTRTPLEAYNAQIRELNLLHQQGFIDQDTMTRAVVAAKMAYREASGAVARVQEEMQRLQDAQQRSEDLARDFGSAFASAIDNVANRAESARGILQGLLSDILSVVNRQFVMPGIESAVGSGLGFLGGLFSGGTIGGGEVGGVPLPMLAGQRAGGGPVAAGQAYLVGEREPEVFVPDRSGTIYNQGQMGGLGGTSIDITYRVDARGADAGMLSRIQVMLDRTKAETIQQVMSLMEDGGRMARASGRRASL